MRWMIGASYQDDKTRDDQEGTYTASNSGIGPLRYHDFINANHQKIDTKAAFGSLDFKLRTLGRRNPRCGTPNTTITFWGVCSIPAMESSRRRSPKSPRHPSHQERASHLTPPPSRPSRSSRRI